MDFEAYLNRIGLSGAPAPDRFGLDRLIRAHKRAVPFENLDIFDFSLPISLAPDDLYEKIVRRRRGGYCFELNGLFAELLRGLGYSCWALAARVPRAGVAHPMLSHRVNVVELEGRAFFCDVGFGGPSPDGAADLGTGFGDFSFRREGRQTVMLHGGEPCLLFSEEPFEEADFLSLNEYQSRNPASYCKSRRLVNLTTADGSVSLTNDTLRRRRGDVWTERELAPGQWREILEPEFGLRL